MSDYKLTFFHVSDKYLEKFISQETERPSFYWFGDRYHDLFINQIARDYFYFFIKNPKEDKIELRARHEGLGFDGMYKHFINYRNRAEEIKNKKINKYCEPSILMSFSSIIPDFIARRILDSDEFIIIKPEAFYGQRFRMFDNTNYPRKFSDIPEIRMAIPELIRAIPFLEPEKINGQYVYQDWLPMITERMGPWI